MVQHNLCFCALFTCGGPCHLSTIKQCSRTFFSFENSLFIHIWKDCKSVLSPVLYCKHQKCRVWILPLKLQTAPLSRSVVVLSAKYQNKSTPAAEWLLSGSYHNIISYYWSINVQTVFIAVGWQETLFYWTLSYFINWSRVFSFKTFNLKRSVVTVSVRWM